MSPFGLVSWAPCCLGTDWPNEHLACGDYLQLGKLPTVLYWRTGIFARLLLFLLCFESCPLSLFLGVRFCWASKGVGPWGECASPWNKCPSSTSPQGSCVFPGHLSSRVSLPRAPLPLPGGMGSQSCGLGAVVVQTVGLDGAWPSFPFLLSLSDGPWHWAAAL